MLAGHQYKVSNQRHHSIRNYLNAQEVIQDKGWKQAELHVNEIIGIHALQLGDKIKVVLGWKHKKSFLLLGFQVYHFFPIEL